MAFRNLMVSSKAAIRLHNGNITVETDTAERSVPLEDINSLLLESRQSIITSAALCALAQAGATVYVCDERHIPCAAMLPFAPNARNYGVLKKQESLTAPAQKRLWRQIVKGKIANQARCLAISGDEESAEHLSSLEKTVLSGDSKNAEAVAAAFYFKALFGKGFFRNDAEDFRNSALNYGYAVLRGHIARLLVSYGFLPMKGIHHKSELNAFNLADDFIEPFRPLADLFVADYCASHETAGSDLDPDVKKGLYNLLNLEMQSGEQLHSVSYAAERTVQSFMRCCEKTSKELTLPVLLPLKQHAYE